MSSSKSTHLKKILVLDFDGKANNWEGWSEKFLARAKRKGYKELLMGTKAIPTKDALAADQVDPKDVEIGDLNEEAFEDIILSIDHSKPTGKIAFSLVRNCKNSDFPEGNCKLAWDRLIAKYAPHTAPSLLKLKKQFANSVLRNAGTPPDEWITELETLRNDMDQIDIATKMSDLDFLIHIINNLPELYDVVLDGMEERLMLKDGNPQKLTLEQVREKLNNRYERKNDRDDAEDAYDADNVGLSSLDSNAEAAFVAFMKQFKGTCNRCGKYGHKGADCRNNDSDVNTFRGSCHYCDTRGHKSDTCELKKAHMRGIGLKQDENAQVAFGTLDESSGDESFDELGF